MISGHVVISPRILPEGTLQIEDTWQAIYVDDDFYKPVGWFCTLRKCYLNDQLIIDPKRAQELADKAGLSKPVQPN